MLLPYAKSLGAVTFAAVGNCWGGYMVMRLSSYAEFKAGKHRLNMELDLQSFNWAPCHMT